MANNNMLLRLRQSTAPWLMLGANCNGCEDTRCRCCFYDVVEQQYCHHHHVDLPGDKTCRGSAFGWLFMVQQTPCVFLLNPLTGNQFPLPPITTFPDVLAYRPEKLHREYILGRAYNGRRRKVAQDKKYTEKRYILKVALSGEPGGEEELVVMAICFNGKTSLAFCKPANNDGIGKWTLIPNPGGRLIAFADVVFWRGQFYALDHDGSVFVSDLSVPDDPKLSSLVDLFPGYPDISDHRYLVISPTGDELMMVTRDISLSQEFLAPFEGHRGGVKYIDDDDDEEGEDEEEVEEAAAATARSRSYWTSKFRVYKLANDDDDEGWKEVKSIGDFALFLGFNSPTFVSTEEHPGLTPNSIYFTDDVTNFHPWWSDSQSGHDIGIYNLTTATIQPLCSESSASFIMHNPPPVWISPPK